MYLDFSASLSTIFLWLLLTLGIAFFGLSVSTFTKRTLFFDTKRFSHYFCLNIFCQIPLMSSKKYSLFFTCSQSLMIKPRNVKSRIRNFRLSFISITEASVPITPNPNTCSNGGMWLISLINNRLIIQGHRDFPNAKKACPCFDVKTQL